MSFARSLLGVIEFSLAISTRVLSSFKSSKTNLVFSSAE